MNKRRQTRGFSLSITSGVNTTTYSVKLCLPQAMNGRGRELTLHCCAFKCLLLPQKQQYDSIFDVNVDVAVNITTVPTSGYER
jgi:hypothetical protein